MALAGASPEEGGGLLLGQALDGQRDVARAGAVNQAEVVGRGHAVQRTARDREVAGGAVSSLWESKSWPPTK